MGKSLEKRFQDDSIEPSEIIKYAELWGLIPAMSRYSVRDLLAFRKFLEAHGYKAMAVSQMWNADDARPLAYQVSERLRDKFDKLTKSNELLKQRNKQLEQQLLLYQQSDRQRLVDALTPLYDLLEIPATLEAKPKPDPLALPPSEPLRLDKPQDEPQCKNRPVAKQTSVGGHTGRTNKAPKSPKIQAGHNPPPGAPKALKIDVIAEAEGIIQSKSMSGVSEEYTESMNHSRLSKKPEYILVTDDDWEAARPETRSLLIRCHELGEPLKAAYWEAVRREDWKRALIIYQRKFSPYLDSINRVLYDEPTCRSNEAEYITKANQFISEAESLLSER